MTKDRIIAQIEGEGDPVIVFERDQYLGLRMAEDAGLIQGYRHRYRPLDFRSEYLQGHLSATLAVQSPESALCLGLGVGAMPRLLAGMYPGIQVTAVELNDTVARASMDYFGLGTMNSLDVHIGCAADFISHGPQQSFDLVLVDCYDAYGIPAACRSTVFFDGVVQRLSPKGALIANLLPKRRGVRSAFRGWTDRLTTYCIPSLRRSNHTLLGLRVGGFSVSQALERLNEYESAVVPFSVEDPLRRTLSGRRLEHRF